VLTAEPNRVQLPSMRIDPRPIDAERPRERVRIDQPCGRRRQLVPKQCEHALGDRLDVVGLKAHAGSPLQSATEVSPAIELALEAAFHDQVGGLDEAVVAFAFGDERSRIVAELVPFAPEVVDAVRSGSWQPAR